MLIAFRAENVHSFRDPIELSLLATRLSEEDVPREIPWRQDGNPISVLPVAGIFGANASGKSNLLKAMYEMRRFVLDSFRAGTPGGSLETTPFMLGEDRGSVPSTYEVEVVIDGIRYVYGFRLDSERIIDEWARSYPHGRPATLLDREDGHIRLGAQERATGRATEKILRPNALFLSTAAATNHPTFLPLYTWFQRNLLYADVHSRNIRQGITTKLLEEEGERRERVLDLLRAADLGITGVERRKLAPEFMATLEKVIDVIRGEVAGEDAPEIPFDDFDLRLKHRARGEDVEFLDSQESWGTMVWFGLIGPVVEALESGSVLLADELEASLHPMLAAVLVDLFQSKESNPRRAQLIFNSHAVTLMGDSADRPLGRDQIWFTEKDDDGASRLYALSDLAPRRDEAIGRRYLAGRYGGAPILSRRRIRQIAEPVDNTEE